MRFLLLILHYLLFFYSVKMDHLEVSKIELKQQIDIYY
jgi:hypothetical protein